MLRVSYRINDKTTIHAEGENTADVFEKLAKLQEVFGETHAIKYFKTDKEMRGKDLIYRVREHDGNKFYELYCPSIQAKLPFGMNKETGDIYPKRLKTDDKGKAVKDENGKAVYLPDRGWRRWNRETKQEE